MRQGEAKERADADKAFNTLYVTYASLINVMLPVMLFMAVIETFGSLTGYAVVALPVFTSGKLNGQPLTADTVLSAIGLLVTLSRSMTTILPLIVTLGGLGGYAHRVRRQPRSDTRVPVAARPHRTPSASMSAGRSPP